MSRTTATTVNSIPPSVLCSEECQCPACQWRRIIAQRTCVLCNQRIGLERDYLEDSAGHCFVHGDCAAVPARVAA